MQQLLLVSARIKCLIVVSKRSVFSTGLSSTSWFGLNCTYRTKVCVLVFFSQVVLSLEERRLCLPSGYKQGLSMLLERRRSEKWSSSEESARHRWTPRRIEADNEIKLISLGQYRLLNSHISENLVVDNTEISKKCYAVYNVTDVQMLRVSKCCECM